MPGLWVDGRLLAAQIRYYTDCLRFIYSVKRMPKPKSFLRIFTESGPLIALAVAVALFLGLGGPPQRQQPQRGGGGWFGNEVFAPFQQQAPRRYVAPREDASRAPAPEKRETTAERNVLVLGDGMADWLAYGLESAYSETPDMGVVRKHKTVSGLIRYQPKGDPVAWPAAAKGILATEKPDVVVVMLGFNDRVSIREPVVKADAKPADGKKDARVKPDGKPGETKPSDGKASDAKPAAKPDGAADAAAKPDDKPADTELSDDADNADAPPVIAPEKSTRSPNGVYEFRETRWVELYTKKIEEMIGVVKAKGVPVVWV